MDLRVIILFGYRTLSLSRLQFKTYRCKRMATGESDP